MQTKCNLNIKDNIRVLSTKSNQLVAAAIGHLSQVVVVNKQPATTTSITYAKDNMSKIIS